LPGEQVDQGGQLAPRLEPADGIGQRRGRIHQEHPPGRVTPIEHPPPIVADVLVHVGMGLDEDQPGAACRRGQLVGHPGAAVLLLCGSHQQHVAVRQQMPQPRQIGARRLRILGGVRVGAVDQHQLGQRGQVTLHQFDPVGADAQHLG
jgi:hypothetical protein